MWTTDFCMSLVAVWCSPDTHFLSLFIWLFWLPDYPSLYPKPWASPPHKCTSSSLPPPPSFLPLHASSMYVTSLALSSFGQKGKVKPIGMKLGMESSNRRCFCCLVTQSCPALYDPMDCSLPDSSVHGISQARILKWVAIFFSRRSSWPRDWTWISCIGRQFLYCWATREASWFYLFHILAAREGRFLLKKVLQFSKRRYWNQ